MTVLEKQGDEDTVADNLRLESALARATKSIAASEDELRLLRVQADRLDRLKVAVRPVLKKVRLLGWLEHDEYCNCELCELEGVLDEMYRPPIGVLDARDARIHELEMLVSQFAVTAHTKSGHDCTFDTCLVQGCLDVKAALSGDLPSDGDLR